MLFRRVTADPSQLAPLRVSLRSWFARARIDDADARDLLLACVEACNNAIEHAYTAMGSGELCIEARLIGSEAHISVRDFGHWRPPAVAGDRGRGSHADDALCDSVEVMQMRTGTMVTIGGASPRACPPDQGLRRTHGARSGRSGRVVTGASQGIGRAIAAELVAEGARVAVSSRSRERIDTTAAEIGATPFVHDSADVGGAAKLVAQVASALGPVEVLVCNTGGPPLGPDPLGFAREQWEAAYRELVLSPWPWSRPRCPRCVSAASGASSTSRRAGARAAGRADALQRPPRGVVTAFKTIARAGGRRRRDAEHAADRPHRDAAAGSTARALDAAREQAREDVPAARLGDPEEMAAAAVFLCSMRAGYVTGETLAVDGGLMRSVF